MERIFELAAKYDRCKSFYGKAHVIERDNGDIDLMSYTTIVATIENGVFRRTWSGYSRTTERHINEFKRQYNIA